MQNGGRGLRGEFWFGRQGWGDDKRGTYEKRNEIVGWETLGAVHANYEMFRFSSTDL